MHRRLVIILSVILIAGLALALYVRLDGDELTLVPESCTLQDVLREFTRAGVSVQIDPDINSRITNSWYNADVQDALESLLDPYGYVVVWDVLEGPVGTLPKLSEIQVFKPGEKRRMRPMPRFDGVLNIVTNNGPPYVAEELLVAVKAGTTRSEFKALLSLIGGIAVESVPESNVYLIRLLPDADVPTAVQLLKNDPITAVAEPNYVYEQPGLVLTEISVDAPSTMSSPKLIDGAPSVAVIDSGLAEIDALDGVIAGQYDALAPDRAISDPAGHGTQMALIAAGVVQPAGAGEAAALAVPVVAIRSFDENGYASNYAMMRSVNFAVSQGARVLNMSWGSETKSTFLADTIESAIGKDVIVVAAAGNEPTMRPLYPSAYDDVLAVGATGENGQIWEQSNYGDFIALTAPGYAWFPIGHKGPPGSYAGTSISSAYVSRALTMYFAQNPKASRAQAIDALIKSLTDAGDEGKDNVYGSGVLDAEAMKRLLTTP
ncbi:MAG: S8 family serine peptidase [Verrucomicrobia bacterium]|nr:S8 family serine peptidase [Verrucomicrobiota bacterium]